MREIKFKIWDKEQKGFINNGKPFYLGDLAGKMWAFMRERHTMKEKYEMLDGAVAISMAAQGYDSKYIILQYTGLKDKNGKEIYEGDIVEYSGVNGGIPGGQIGGKDIINYDEEEACFKFGNFSFVNDANQFNDNFPDYDDIEVIGNIYETPGLLKE